MDVERSRVVDSGAGSLVDVPVQLNVHVREDDKLGDDILKDFETCWEDISDRLTVSRMVSDSVIKGMVNAVEEEAVRKITEKEAELKDALYLYHVGAEDSQCVGGPVVCCEAKDARDGIFCGVSTSQQCGITNESLGTLRNIARVQLRKLKIDIDSAKGSDTISRIGSGSEFVGLGGVQPEQASDRWAGVDKSLHYLTVSLESVCRQVEKITSSNQTSLVEWREEQEFLGEIEEIVTRSCIRGLQKQFEEKLWEQSAKFCAKEAANCVEKVNEISRVREQLEVISKSISHIETEFLASHCLDMGEVYGDDKSIEYFYRKNLGHVWEGNGKHEVSKSNLPEIDPNKLKHSSTEELNHFYNNEITALKRNHESQVQELTEELFTLKGEVLRLRERGSPLPSKREKEMDALRKKIQEFIPNLEHVIKQIDNFSFANSAESIRIMKERLESLVSENNHLKDLLTEKTKEIRSLSLQVTDAVAKISQNSAAEANLLNLIGSRESDLDDAHVKAALCEDVYKCVLGELTDQVRCIIEESLMTSNVMQDIYETPFEDATHCAEPNVDYEIEDSEVETMIMQEFCGAVFREALKDTAEKLNKLSSDYIKENEFRVSLEQAAMSKQILLMAEVAENERLKQELVSVDASKSEKDKLSTELTFELAKERDRLDIAMQEVDKLRNQTSDQQMLISKTAEELNVTKSNLVELQRQLEQYKEEVKKLDEERKMFLFLITQEKQNSIVQSDAREREHRKQLESTVSFIQEFLKSAADMESRVTEGCWKVSSRLENLNSQVLPLVHEANTLRKTCSSYKQRLEGKCADLHKAEVEVDLLGNDRDALLSLLEKIYIGLDHYFPILQHYPGITEVLKLIKRELSGDSTKSN